MADGDTTVLPARTSTANIRSNAAMVADAHNPLAYSDPDLDGTLQLLETAGNLNGARCGPQTSAATPMTELSASNGTNINGGIFVHGDVRYPITIDYEVDRASIVARNFLAPISIGRWMKGCVVAGGCTERQRTPRT